MKLLDFFRKKTRVPPVVKPEASSLSLGYSSEVFDGSKYFGGFGPTKLFTVDYETLRLRSSQLFRENLYARGLIRRLVTNEINTGLSPEVDPNEKILGVPEESLGDWAEMVEDRFFLWTSSPRLCDTTWQSDFGGLQREIRRESLIIGDVLVVVRLDRKTGLPRVQVIRGEDIVTPTGKDLVTNGNRVVHGVEINAFNQQVAYYVKQDDGSFVRIAAYGSKSGRRVAWLVYGCDKRVNEVRGEPLLSIVLQSIKEIDRYRDATQRKAAINAILAMFIKKTQDKIGTKPITGGAVRKTSVTTQEVDGTARKYDIANHIPGLVMETLQYGEEPVAFGNQGIDTTFGEFEAALIHAIAWSNEIPPEILQLAFSNNYSASQASINEFKNYLNRIRADFSCSLCQPIYVEWLISEVLSQKIEAPGLLESWRDPLLYDIFAAWTSADWGGAIKPSTDIRKQAQGYEIMVGNGWITNARATKELTGTKFRRNMRRLARENEEKANAGLAVLGVSNPVDSDDSEGDNDEGAA